MEQAAKLCGTQVISQLHKNQNGRFRHTHISLERYFTQSPGVPQRISIRGDEEVTVMVSSARLSGAAHHKKRFVIALKYADETDYGSVVASDTVVADLGYGPGLYPEVACRGFPAGLEGACRMGAVDHTARRRRIKPRPDPESAARSRPPLPSAPTSPPGKQPARVHRGRTYNNAPEWTACWPLSGT